jgi:hypothetical protein
LYMLLSLLDSLDNLDNLDLLSVSERSSGSLRILTVYHLPKYRHMDNTRFLYYFFSVLWKYIKELLLHMPTPKN